MSATESYKKHLAQQINAALKAAEQYARKEGFSLYPFLFGYLHGDLSPEQIAAHDVRIDALLSDPTPGAK